VHVITVHILFFLKSSSIFTFVSFFFQAEDGIRDFHVTGVQTCALPILGATTCSFEPTIWLGRGSAKPWPTVAWWFGRIRRHGGCRCGGGSRTSSVFGFATGRVARDCAGRFLPGRGRSLRLRHWVISLRSALDSGASTVPSGQH